jgi:hypothetical protein
MAYCKAVCVTIRLSLNLIIGYWSYTRTLDIEDRVS